MRMLFIAVYFEGTTDERFLPEIVVRTAADLLTGKAARDEVEIAPPEIVRKRTESDARTGAERVAEAAEDARNADLLVVHADADNRDATRALVKRYRPGRDIADARRAEGRAICDALVPIIPIRMTEAWMLADHAALATQVSGLDPKRLPSPPKQVERVQDPKSELEGLLRQAGGKRRRNALLRELYLPLARSVDLDCLRRVPAFMEFETDLKSALTDRGFLTS